MANTTTIRVDLGTHERLVELSRAADTSLIQTVRDAAEALRRERYARRVRAEFAALRADPQAWQQYLADAELTAVTDGVD
ncbi:MAG: hypothetical protein OXG55_02690 [bacterium]|nr:hypothetical protein [bacterium]MCY3951962.1 hypothetical protein [bacterium]MCY4102164.1 hypothetical protein [bacterium]